ncbi:hypothetical protein F5984_26020 [Rudanella paleaurantiibacter]|uniref:Uncharacterized protein n=1 Tax=Rudanella paleaurantiibacter TaxID=2614655 RepID=A0A7J5TRR4_9BACT|nr:hypothetical protein [Rudanella paleaurantiibacter]KAB7725502.1 hypothetical protein F5984_26020 [Rudanella paleaurantiibacter]
MKTNPYADEDNEPIKGQELEFMAWYTQDPSAYLATLPEDERAREEERMAFRNQKMVSEQF